VWTRGGSGGCVVGGFVLGSFVFLLCLLLGFFLCPSRSGASEGTGGAFLCPSKGGASEESRGVALCPSCSGASGERRSSLTSVVGSAEASSTGQIGVKNGDLHGGGGREGVWVAPKYTNATGFWKAECPWWDILASRSTTTVGILWGTVVGSKGVDPYQGTNVWLEFLA
jgi:hypothetical protein